jgi:hypothetical protein
LIRSRNLRRSSTVSCDRGRSPAPDPDELDAEPFLAGSPDMSGVGRVGSQRSEAAELSCEVSLVDRDTVGVENRFLVSSEFLLRIVVSVLLL